VLLTDVTTTLSSRGQIVIPVGSRALSPAGGRPFRGGGQSGDV